MVNDLGGLSMIKPQRLDGLDGLFVVQRNEREQSVVLIVAYSQWLEAIRKMSSFQKPAHTTLHCLLLIFFGHKIAFYVIRKQFCQFGLRVSGHD